MFSVCVASLTSILVLGSPVFINGKKIQQNKYQILNVLIGEAKLTYIPELKRQIARKQSVCDVAFGKQNIEFCFYKATKNKTTLNKVGFQSISLFLFPSDKWSPFNF